MFLFAMCLCTLYSGAVTHSITLLLIVAHLCFDTNSFDKWNKKKNTFSIHISDMERVHILFHFAFVFTEIRFALFFVRSMVTYWYEFHVALLLLLLLQLFSDTYQRNGFEYTACTHIINGKTLNLINYSKCTYEGKYDVCSASAHLRTHKTHIN